MAANPSVIDRLRERLHRRKRRARREARAVRKIRRAIRHLVALATAPRSMVDSVTVSEIPVDTPAAGGYVGGEWPTYENGELRARCPHARLVSFAVASKYRADILDIERGDATIEDAPEWWRLNKDHGARGFYISASDGAALEIYLEHHGVPRAEYVLGSAHYGDGKHICGPKTCGYLNAPANGTQYDDHDGGVSRDVWVLRPSFWR